MNLSDVNLLQIEPIYETPALGNVNVLDFRLNNDGGLIAPATQTTCATIGAVLRCRGSTAGVAADGLGVEASFKALLLRAVVRRWWRSGHRFDEESGLPSSQQMHCFERRRQSSVPSQSGVKHSRRQQSPLGVG